MFSSDNGLHTGEYRLMPGKMTAFDTDIHVPLVIPGPGIPAGARPTRSPRTSTSPRRSPQIGGHRPRGDGHSLLPLFGGSDPPRLANAS